MSPFNFSEPELLTFFAVLVRFSVLISVLPIVGDRFVPQQVKILLSLAISMALFPALVNTGQVKPADAVVWGRDAVGIVATIGTEALFGVIIGFIARMAFDSISFGANLTGTFMGFAMASTYDPHQENQTQVIAEIQVAVATLIFLALDGHHLMLRAALESYRIVGLGQLQMGAAFSQRLLEITGQVIRLGIQLSAPVAVSIFAVNVAFAVISRAMPQMNVFALSFAVTSLVGLAVMFLGLPEFSEASGAAFERMIEWIGQIERSLAGT